MGSLPYTEDAWHASSSSLHSTLQSRSPSTPPSPLGPFLQRSSNRSPVESPPVSKRALMRVAMPQQDSTPDRFHGHHVEAFIKHNQSSSGTPPAGSASGKENTSILKPSSGREAAAKATKGKRRVEFEPSVQVFCFDKVAGDHVSSGSERLSAEPKDRREFMNRTFQNKFKVISGGNSNGCAAAQTNGQRGNVAAAVDAAKSQKKGIFIGGGGVLVREPPLQYSPTVSSPDQPPASGNRQSAAALPRPLPLPHPTPSASALPLAEGYVPSAVDFTFFEDEAQRLRIKFTIPLGEGVAATDVLVKANMTGNKVRVVASRTVPAAAGAAGGVGGGASEMREEFSERYLLPMEVDPYLITARLDSVGNLFVEAPIMTAERKRALAAEKQSKLANSNSAISNGHAGFSL